MEQNQNELNQNESSELNQNESSELNQSLKKRDNFLKFLKNKLIKVVFILLICYSALLVISSVISGNGFIGSLISAIFPILFTVFLGLAIYSRDYEQLHKRLNSISVTYTVQAILIWLGLALTFIVMVAIFPMIGNLQNVFENQGATKAEAETVVKAIQAILIIGIVFILIGAVVATIYNINMMKLLKGMTEATQSCEHKYCKYLKIIKVFSLIFGIIMGIYALSTLSSISAIGSNKVIIEQYIELIKENYGYDVSGYINVGVTSLVLNFLSNAVLSAIYIISYVIFKKLEKEIIYQEPVKPTSFNADQMQPF